ncbi:MAG: hypothetical protein JOY99_08435 [Sphingomonadaceae bacterium]|nr:hypothetical protein [Sphingomonadaceae bacterium]
MAEAEFADAAAMARYPAPDFARREVTVDLRYTGGTLVVHELPDDHRAGPV